MPRRPFASGRIGNFVNGQIRQQPAVVNNELQMLNGIKHPWFLEVGEHHSVRMRNCSNVCFGEGE